MGNAEKGPGRALRAFSTGVHILRQPRQIHSPMEGVGGEQRLPRHAYHAAASRAWSNRARCEEISFSLSYRSFVVISL